MFVVFQSLNEIDLDNSIRFDGVVIHRVLSGHGPSDNVSRYDPSGDVSDRAL